MYCSSILFGFYLSSSFFFPIFLSLDHSEGAMVFCIVLPYSSMAALRHLYHIMHLIIENCISVSVRSFMDVRELLHCVCELVSADCCTSRSGDLTIGTARYMWLIICTWSETVAAYWCKDVVHKFTYKILGASRLYCKWQSYTVTMCGNEILPRDPW